MSNRVAYGRLVEIQDMLLHSPLNIVVIKNWKDYYDTLNRAASCFYNSIAQQGNTDRLKVIQDKGCLYIVKVKS